MSSAIRYDVGSSSSLIEGERTSGDVTETVRAEFGISQPAVSQHLKVLRDAGFVDVRVDGARRFYALRAEPLHGVDAWLAPFRCVLGAAPRRPRHRDQAGAVRTPPANTVETFRNAVRSVGRVTVDDQDVGVESCGERTLAVADPAP